MIVTSTKELPDLNNEFVLQERGRNAVLSNQNEYKMAPRPVGKKKVTWILPQTDYADWVPHPC